MERGSHLITELIIKEIPEISEFSIGLINLIIQHTSASLTINENNNDFKKDLNIWLDNKVPENFPWTHTDEGSDDMPAHVKSSLLGTTLTIPITEGKINLGKSQGIYLNEHRNYGGSRKIIITLTGKKTI